MRARLTSSTRPQFRDAAAWLHRGAPQGWGDISPTQTALLLRTSRPHTVILSLTQGCLPLLGCTQLPVRTRFLFAAPQRAQPRTPTHPDPQEKPPFLSSLAAARFKRLHPTAGHPTSQSITQICDSSFPHRTHRNRSSVGAAPLKQPPTHTQHPLPSPQLPVHSTAVIPINSHPFPSMRQVFIQLHSQTNRYFPFQEASIAFS